MSKTFPTPFTHDGNGRIIGADGFTVASVETVSRILPDWDQYHHRMYQGRPILHWADGPGLTYIEVEDEREAVATADLFCAAPDLLAACEAAEQVIDSLIGMFGDSGAGLVMRQCRAAIAKARGEVSDAS